MTAVYPLQKSSKSTQRLMFISAGSDHRMFLWDVDLLGQASVRNPPLAFEGCPHKAEITSVVGPKTTPQTILSGGMDKRLAMYSLSEGNISVLGSTTEVSSVTGLTLAEWLVVPLLVNRLIFWLTRSTHASSAIRISLQPSSLLPRIKWPSMICARVKCAVTRQHQHAQC